MNRIVVLQEIAKLDERGRIRISTKSLGTLDWLSKESSPTEALAVLEQPGQILLLPWESEYPKIQARKDELLEAKTSADTLEALALIEDRYKKLTIPSDLRPSLSQEMLLHLGMLGTDQSYIYILRIDQRIELHSKSFRDDFRNQNPEHLKGLP